jgi:hypothetical protein
LRVLPARIGSVAKFVTAAFVKAAVWTEVPAFTTWNPETTSVQVWTTPVCEWSTADRALTLR